MAKKNAVDYLVDQVLEPIENGDVPIWRKPWIPTHFRNPLNGTVYRGCNVMFLALYAMAHDLQSPTVIPRGSTNFGKSPPMVTVTRTAWDENAGMHVEYEDRVPRYTVREGGRFCKLAKWNYPSDKMMDEYNEQQARFERGLVEEKPRRPHGYWRYFQVISTSFIDFALDEDREAYHQDMPDVVPFASALHDEWFAAWESQPVVEHVLQDAAYHQAAHYVDGVQTGLVVMPLMSQFTDEGDYYATLWHELGHSTKIKSRCDRGDTHKTKRAYAKEELVAELFSLLIRSMFGVSGVAQIENTQGYIADWYKVLANDKKLFLSAASAASYAVDWTFKRNAEMRERLQHVED